MVYTHQFTFSALLAEAAASKESAMSKVFARDISGHTTLDEAIAALLARTITSYRDDYDVVHSIIQETWGDELARAFTLDIQAIRTKDPACSNWLTPFLNFKGFHALQAYRVANALWNKGDTQTATWIQGLVSKALSVDIHPAAQFGHGIFVDHATGLVVGETAVVGNNVTLFHLVTLGGNGKQSGDRHPIIKDGAVLYAGAKVIGRITIGKNSIVGASANVLEDVPDDTTVVGNPARPVNKK